MPESPRRRSSRFAVGLLVGALGLAGALSGCRSGPEALDDDGPLLTDLARAMGGTTPAQAAREAFDREDPDKRRRAIAMLSSADWGGEPAYVAVYRLILTDPAPTVRAACVAALGRHGDADDAVRVARQLTAEEAFLRWEAAKALRHLHNPAVVPALIAALQRDEDSDTRMAAAEALGQYPRRDAFDALVSALTEAEFGVAHAARGSLVTLTGADVGSEPTDWQAWASERSGGEAMFADGQPYRAPRYVKPAGLLDKAKFWQSRDIEAQSSASGVDGES